MTSLLASLILAAQTDPKNPDYLSADGSGIAINRPPKPKNDEWELKTDGGHFSNSKLVVMNKKDKISVEIIVSDPVQSGGLVLSVIDLPGSLDNMWKSIEKDPQLTEQKKKSDLKKATKLPGNAAGGAAAFFLDATFRDKNDKAMEMKVWMFQGKENQYIYRVIVVGEDKLYAKYQKEIDYILATVRTFKIKSK